MSGMRAALLALLLIAARQEEVPSPDGLIDRLSHDRVEVREAAVTALARLDLDAVPGLEGRLAGLGPEARLRLEEAIRRIRARFRILDYLPAYKPVSLTLDQASPHDALQALREKTGLPIDLDNLPAGRPVTLVLADQPPLQALQAICREAMLGWEFEGILDWRERAHGKPPARIRIHFVTERWHRPIALAFVRHYMIRATTDDWEQALGEPRETISLTLTTAPGARPYSMSSLRLSALTDAQGNDLLERSAPIKEGFQRLGMYSRGRSYKIAFTRPPGTLVRVGRLAATVTVRYPKAVRWVRFQPLKAPFGQVSEGMGRRFILREYKRQGTEHEATLDIVSLDGLPVLKGLEEGKPFDYSDMELRMPDGESVEYRGGSGAGGDSAMIMSFRFHSKADAPAAELRIPWADEFVEDEVAFELRDIRGMNE